MPACFASAADAIIERSGFRTPEVVPTNCGECEEMRFRAVTVSKGAVITLRDTEGGADAPVRAGPPGPTCAEPGGSAAGQGTRPTNGVFN